MSERAYMPSLYDTATEGLSCSKTIVPQRKGGYRHSQVPYCSDGITVLELDLPPCLTLYLPCTTNWRDHQVALLKSDNLHKGCFHVVY